MTFLAALEAARVRIEHTHELTVALGRAAARDDEGWTRAILRISGVVEFEFDMAEVVDLLADDWEVLE